VQKVSLIAISLMIASATSHSAYAADAFYLEIGNQGTADEISAEWKKLSKKHKNLLGKLEFFPKSVTDKGGDTAHIIQAGPITEKRKAQAICNKLFARDVSCFVIEGIEDRPPSSSVSMSKMFSGTFVDDKSTQKIAVVAPSVPVDSAPQVLGEVSSPAPVIKEEIAAPVEKPSAKEDAPAPVVISEKLVETKVEPKAELKPAETKAAEVKPDSKPAEVKEEAKLEQKIQPKAESKIEPKAEPKIDVAQAIPVPLSNKTSGTSGSAVVAKELAPVEFATGDAGWLNVSSFKTAGEANNFWDNVHGKYVDLTAGLRVRVQKSLIANNSSGRYQLSFGPFSSGNDAKQFCAKAIKAVDERLSCVFEKGDAAISGNIEEAPVTYERSNAYEERRKLLRQASQKNSKSEQTIVTHEDGENSFWAQVVIADSKSEAKRRLEDIKAKNSDVLEGVSSKVTSSPVRHAKYNVRLGPLANETSALELCETLQSRGFDCLVVTTK